MAHIPRLTSLNEVRQRALFVEKGEDSLLLTPDELREMVDELIKDELGLFSSEVIKEEKLKMETRLNSKLKQLETGLLSHINEKVNKIAERIVEATINRVIEGEVNKRLDEKLAKAKIFLTDGKV